MPPRKSKVSIKSQVIEETPVVFFLRIPEDTTEKITPASDVPILYSEIDPAPTNYSSILNSVEFSKVTSHFNTDLLKSVLDKCTSPIYSSQTVCFWCCHTFGWTNIVLPTSYDAYKNVYTCEGYFCSPECALAYNYAESHISDSIKWNRHALLGFLYHEMYHDRLLSPAPPRTLLRMFGGPLDIEQYRDYLTTDNNIVLSASTPIRLIFPSMNVQGPLRDIKKHVSLSNDAIEKASEQLRLKRSKPVNSTVQTIDKCIVSTSS